MSARVRYRAMTDDERTVAAALGDVRYVPATFEKRFGREIAARAAAGIAATCTDRQADELWRVAWRFRRQLTDAARALVLARGKPAPRWWLLARWKPAPRWWELPGSPLPTPTTCAHEWRTYEETTLYPLGLEVPGSYEACALCGSLREPAA